MIFTHLTTGYERGAKKELDKYFTIRELITSEIELGIFFDVNVKTGNIKGKISEMQIIKMDDTFLDLSVYCRDEFENKMRCIIAEKRKIDNKEKIEIVCMNNAMSPRLAVIEDVAYIMKGREALYLKPDSRLARSVINKKREEREFVIERQKLRERLINKYKV